MLLRKFAWPLVCVIFRKSNVLIYTDLKKRGNSSADMRSASQAFWPPMWTLEKVLIAVRIDLAGMNLRSQSSKHLLMQDAEVLCELCGGLSETL